MPNPVSTGASTGTAFNAAAVQQACERLRERLTDYCPGCSRERAGLVQDSTASTSGTTRAGWNTRRPKRRHRTEAVGATSFRSRTRNASSLSSPGAPSSGGEAPVPALTFKPWRSCRNPRHRRRPEPASPAAPSNHFTGFTSQRACTEVEIDVLTGEMKVLRADLFYDMGRASTRRSTSARSRARSCRGSATC